MTRSDWVILCVAYIVGLLSTNLLTDGENLAPQLGIVIAGIIGLATVSKIVWRQLRTPRLIAAVIVALLAIWYFQLRLPQPQANDISYQVTRSQSESVTVSGTVLTEPRLNDRALLRFWLKANQINHQENVSGKVYVTVPLLQGTGIYPGQQLNISGLLYLPQGASNPGGFDFQKYLARQGIFAGIKGLTVTSDSQAEPVWGWWQLRRRIVRSHLKGLGSPLGQLVSSMVLGRKAVDLPSTIRDRFIEAGLAHVLAASGFHVSLLLGLVLRLTSTFNGKTKLVIGSLTLLVYLGLTGIQASVLRACLMGFAVLLALAMDTKVKPLGSLLLAAAIILLVNPLLIGDLGFQLSFLATFGLIVTMPSLEQQLEWLPTTVATAVAVPLAASIWVLPLLCYVFHTFATYSIVVNILTTPLITIISLGGMISAIAGLILPAVGSAIAELLYYPTLLLVTIVKFFTNLPGSTWAVGQIPLVILGIIYSLLIAIWLSKWCRQRWGLISVVLVCLMMIPAINNFDHFEITVLGAKQSQIIVIQDRRQTVLINSGQSNQAQYIVLPFLRQQGINRIDYGLALDENSNSQAEWKEISQRATVKNFNSMNKAIEVDNLFLAQAINTSTNKSVTTSAASLSLNQKLGVISLQVDNVNWLIIDPAAAKQTNYDHYQQAVQQYINEKQLQLREPIIVWSGTKLDSAWLESLQPKIAIASTNSINPATLQQLRQKQIKLHNTAQAGGISWTIKNGFTQLSRSYGHFQ
ncbi:MAG: ComEC/Rec2 family competence protein [Cyanobacteria bacterium P01_G01_bin.39]